MLLAVLVTPLRGREAGRNLRGIDGFLLVEGHLVDRGRGNFRRDLDRRLRLVGFGRGGRLHVWLGRSFLNCGLTIAAVL